MKFDKPAGQNPIDRLAVIGKATGLPEGVKSAVAGSRRPEPRPTPTSATRSRRTRPMVT